MRNQQHLIPFLLSLIMITNLMGASLTGDFYADINDELMNLPVSAAMAGSDLSISSGASPSSSPANLPFDSLNRLTFSYANYFQNTFSTSLLSYNGIAGNDIGYSIYAGYVFLPDVDITDSNETGPYIADKKNCSWINLRVGLGKSFDLSNSIAFSIGGALQAKRVRLIDYNGYGLGIDAGMRILFKKPNLSAALLFENVTSSMTHWSDEYRQLSARHIRIGIGWDKDFQYIYGNLRLAYTTPDILSNEGVNYFSAEVLVDGAVVETPLYEKVYKNPLLLIKAGKVGAEYTILKRVSLRVGLTNSTLNFGAGLNLFNERAGIDFAYMTHVLSGTYQLSLRYCW